MYFNSIHITLFITLVFTYGCSLRTPDYPYAENNVTNNTYFGTTVNDTYQWMEPDSGAILNNWLTAQKKFTDNHLKTISKFKQLHQIVTELSQTPSFSLLKAVGDKLYYLQRSIVSRNNILNVIDINTMENRLIKDPAEIFGSNNFTTSYHQVSSDGNYIAFIISLAEDINKILIYDIKKEVLLPDVINNVNHSKIAWDRNGLYYSKVENSFAEGFDVITQKIYHHKLGTPQSQDQTIFENNSDIFSTFSPVTCDNENMIAIIENCAQTKGRSIYVKNISNNGRIIKITNNFITNRTPIELNSNELYLIVTDNAPKGKLIKIDLNKPSKENWVTIIPEQQKHLTSVTPLKNKFIVTYQDNKNNEAWFYTKDGRKLEKINIPNIGHSEFFCNKYQDKVFFTYTSATCPKILLEVRNDTIKPLVVKFPTTNKIDPRKYISEIIKIPSSRGDSLLVNLTYKMGTKKDKTTPAILFNHTELSAVYLSQFFFTRIFYLEQGYIYAETIEDTKYMVNPLARKPYYEIKDEIDDLITTAHYFIDKEITSKERLCISGREKGATIVMSAVIKDPSIANVISVSRGAYDLLRMPEVKQTWDWIKYFGRAMDKKELFDYIYSYSPVHNVKDGINYPAMIIMAEEDDKFVSPTHSYKLTAALQRASASNNPILLHVSPPTTVNNLMDFRVYSESFADHAAFVMKHTGMKLKTIDK